MQPTFNIEPVRQCAKMMMEKQQHALSLFSDAHNVISQHISRHLQQQQQQSLAERYDCALKKKKKKMSVGRLLTKM
jgi:hypothetical protein